tara:strand:- start:241 stop:762 length:522 start_codon:yes stop_codon:yes gene_type:complete
MASKQKNKELWRDIPNFKGKYQVSNNGRVKSLNYKRSKKEGFLKPSTSRGYEHVELSLRGKSYTMSVHRLVCIAFLENIENKTCVNHIDGVKTNNNLNNLEWCTHSENNIHAIKKGLRWDVSESHWNCKLSRQDVVNIKKLIPFKTQKEISLLFKVNQSTISDIKNNKIRTHE